MKKQKSMGNKGFSLVELIIVIAILAILVGVLAPNLLRYVEKTNVSADTQLADSVKTAITTAMMDPAVINANEATSSVTAFNDAHKTTGVALATDLTGEMLKSVNVTLGYADTQTAADLQKNLIAKLKSAHATDTAINVQITGSNSVTVTITKTDVSAGKKTDGTATPITVQ